MAQREAAFRLHELLTDPRRPHRARWEAHGRAQQGRAVNLASVLKVLADHLVETGELDEREAPRWPRRRKDWIRRTLGLGTETVRLSAAELVWFRDAFALTSADHLLLTDLLRTSGELGLLSTLHVATHGDVRREYVTDRVLEEHRVGPDRLPLLHTTTHTIRATGDGVAAYHYLFDTDQAAVRLRSGGTLEEVVQVSEGFWAARVRLAAPLRRGETARLEYDTYFSYRSPPPPEFRRGSSGNPDAEIDVRVTFHPDARPVAVWQGLWPELVGPPSLEHRVDLDADGCVAVSVTRLTGGLVGLRWEWPGTTAPTTA